MAVMAGLSALRSAASSHIPAGRVVRLATGATWPPGNRYAILVAMTDEEHRMLTVLPNVRVFHEAERVLGFARETGARP